MISLIIPPKDQISRINKMLADEYGTASNIKSRVNRYYCHDCSDVLIIHASNLCFLLLTSPQDYPF